MSLTVADKITRAGRNAVVLGRNTNQALGIARFAIDFLKGALGKGPDPSVIAKVEQFHTDSVICGLSALALRTNAPTVLREEALQYSWPSGGAKVFGSNNLVAPEKAICANVAAVREWDSNGTVFGYNSLFGKGHIAGEFGHNDFYPVVIAACQIQGLDGKTAAHAMILLDEIRGRLAEVFSLKTYKIDHVVHGAIASAATYGALLNATEKQIESAIGMVVAHYIPFRAIRAGHQLSDSKGSSAALSTEVAIMSMHRSMRGFVGPADIFRNPEAIFRFFEPRPKGNHDSPFDIVLSHSGKDFAVMGMHFKLGLYEHQSAGALQGIINLFQASPHLAKSADCIRSIKIVAYEPAFGIIGDPAKRKPTTRQSADHSMVFIVSRLIMKALQLGPEGIAEASRDGTDTLWQKLILTPSDFNKDALVCSETRALMDKIEFEHGGPTYDAKYPDGIPTSVIITDDLDDLHDSGLVMYPAGHARNTDADLTAILKNKFQVLGALAVHDPSSLVENLSDLANKTPTEIAGLYDCELQLRDPID
uniref:MmgE/PrpD N-terminal domain-containing protein n=1 Tax=Spongospora subterranea TaxID=70186 RepID=A0A0H5R7A6_9EUKA|eukprot:CRZ09637.1 hypothetical protein [Spongospora subterranea]